MWAGRLLLCLSLCQVIWTCSVCGRGGCCCVYHCVRSCGHAVCVCWVGRGRCCCAFVVQSCGHAVCVCWGGGVLLCLCGPVMWACSVCVLGGGVAVPLWSGHVGMQCVCVGGGCCCAFVVRSCGHAVCVCWGGGGGVAVPLWSGHVGMQCVCVGGGGGVAVPLWSGHVGMQCVCVGGGGVAVPLWSGHMPVCRVRSGHMQGVGKMGMVVVVAACSVSWR